MDGRGKGARQVRRVTFKVADKRAALVDFDPDGHRAANPVSMREKQAEPMVETQCLISDPHSRPERAGWWVEPSSFDTMSYGR